MAAWQTVALREVVEINPRPDRASLSDDSLASFIPMRCVEEENGRFEPLGDRKVSEVSKGYTPFRDGDVLFAKVTPCMENGKAAVVKGLTNGVGFGSTEFFALRPKDNLDPYYLLHFILQTSFRRDAARNMTGAVGLRRVPKSYLEQQLIPLPSLPEQRRIVAEIEKQFTRLEAGVAALRRVRANLKRYRAAVLKAACEGRLVPTEAEIAKAEKRKFEAGEELLKRILAERRQQRTGRGQNKEPAAPDTANLPPLPEGWTWASADQLSSQITDGEHIQPRYTSEGFPMLSAKHVRDGFVIFTEVPFISEKDFQLCLRRCAPKCDDILIVCVGATTGRAAIVGDAEPFAVVRSVLLIRSLIHPRFMLAWVRSPWCQTWIQSASGSSAQAHFYIRNAKSMAVPLPPLAEQTRIVAEVERRLSVVEELEAVVSANLQRTTRFRQSILHRAFSGSS